MMSLGVGLPVVVTVPEGKSSPGEVRILHLDRKSRFGRALKTWGICWGIALGSALIPLLHFILVPGFFFAGLVAPFLVFSRKSLILGGESRCPKCDLFLPIGSKPEQWPLTILCTNGLHEVTVMPKRDGGTSQVATS